MLQERAFSEEFSGDGDVTVKGSQAPENDVTAAECDAYDLVFYSCSVANILGDPYTPVYLKR